MAISLASFSKGKAGFSFLFRSLDSSLVILREVTLSSMIQNQAPEKPEGGFQNQAIKVIILVRKDTFRLIPGPKKVNRRQLCCAIVGWRTR